MHDGEGRTGLDATQVNSSVHGVYYRPLERRNGRVDRHNAEKEVDGIPNLNWRYKLQVPDAYVAYPQRFVEMLPQFENI